MTTKTWFITGAGSGFGRELAIRLLGGGHRVAATDRDPTQLEDLPDAYGDRLWTAVLDVTDTPAVRRVVDRACDHFGRIDVVVSNAGYGLTTLSSVALTAGEMDYRRGRHSEKHDGHERRRHPPIWWSIDR